MCEVREGIWEFSDAWEGGIAEEIHNHRVRHSLLVQTCLQSLLSNFYTKPLIAIETSSYTLFL